MRRALGGSDSFHRITWRRVTALLLVGVLVLSGSLTLRVFWLLDTLLFPRWNRTPVREAVFVVGNFRSGTTALLRMLEQGLHDATAMRTWEIYLGTTISQRRFWEGMAVLDGALGGSGKRIIQRLNDALRKVPYHPIDLFSAEEDAGVLLYAWSGIFTWFVSPPATRVPEVAVLDNLPSYRRRRTMQFYRAVVQKHLYAQYRRRPSRSPVFLSKNPAFTGAISALRETFPDVRVVTITRERHATIASGSRWFGVWFALLGATGRSHVPLKVVHDLVDRWYEHPRQRSVAEVKHQDLIHDPRRQLQRLARILGRPELNRSTNQFRALQALQRDHGSSTGRAPHVALRSVS